jgi:hypothetical protein
MHEVHARRPERPSQLFFGEVLNRTLRVCTVKAADGKHHKNLTFLRVVDSYCGNLVYIG